MGVVSLCVQLKLTLILGAGASFFCTYFFESMSCSSFCNVTFVLVSNCFRIAFLYTYPFPDTLSWHRFLLALPPSAVHDNDRDGLDHLFRLPSQVDFWDREWEPHTGSIFLVQFLDLHKCLQIHLLHLSDELASDIHVHHALHHGLEECCFYIGCCAGLAGTFGGKVASISICSLDTTSRL